MTCAVYLVARGASALDEARGCIDSLREFHNWPVYLATDLIKVAEGLNDVQLINLPPDIDDGGRWAKISILGMVDQVHDQVLYLDADTRVYGDLSVGFAFLDAGWDMVITASGHQDHELMWHIDTEERDYTLQRIGNGLPLALQAGVFWIKRNTMTARLFRAWCDEWSLYSDQDQASLLRAVNLIPVRIALLGPQFNGGGIIGHRWGAIRKGA